ncbi:MAG: hypothetical protein A3F83_13145 [Candidatus Glassbacteria bacterium RIFCSPLOWO2_12_FULL_58_11]|uniref:Cytidylate kinase n=1 Tax=Candidatus Glassbacteria bacterium RIFCSPLOWO2_12_FULL_58_11 TaxID=1817867 RepID=A0A1F5YWB6_9BACT|nr:MAG: hypothetical protein A3F83_13145 [Candidatus Glassbacteria bacterium RIFCSPLOWO2_12_FULL_58_11]
MKNLKVTQSAFKDRIAQVEEQFRAWEAEGHRLHEKIARQEVRFITISREYGCAGFRIADSLAGILNHDQQDKLAHWTVYDQKLIDLVCSDHKLNRVLVESLDRQRKFALGDLITGMFTSEPSTIKIFKKFAETIFQLAAHGNVIIIGRASSIITSKLSGGLHLRIMAPLEWRVKQVANYEKIEDPKKAHRYVLKNDNERGKFAEDFLGKDLKDPVYYDMVLNQERLGVNGIVKLVLDVMEFRVEKPAG